MSTDTTGASTAPPIPPTHDPTTVITTPVVGPPSFGSVQAQQAAAQVVSATELVSPVGSVVSPADKKRYAKSKPGIEQKVPLLVQLGQRYGVTPTDYTLDQLQSDVGLVTALNQVQAPTIVLNQLLTDTILVTRARYSSALAGVYSALNAIAGHNPELALELQPVVTFFAHKTSKAKAKTAKGEEGAAAPAATGAATPAPTAATPAAAAGATSTQAATPVATLMLAAPSPVREESRLERRDPRREARRY